MPAAIPACPACGTNFDAQYDGPDADGAPVYMCDASHGGAGPVYYDAPPAPAGHAPAGPAKAVRREPGLTDDLLEPLRGCVLADDGWTEFGVVERRLRQAAPDVFARHVREMGHHMFGQKPSTASGSRVSMALRRLRDEGLVVSELRESTGAAWKHTSPISYWALAPVADGAPTLTWEQYCADECRSDGWTAPDRAGLTSPSQGAG